MCEAYGCLCVPCPPSLPSYHQLGQILFVPLRWLVSRLKILLCCKNGRFPYLLFLVKILHCIGSKYVDKNGNSILSGEHNLVVGVCLTCHSYISYVLLSEALVPLSVTKIRAGTKSGISSLWIYSNARPTRVGAKVVYSQQLLWWLIRVCTFKSVPTTSRGTSHLFGVCCCHMPSIKRHSRLRC